MKWFKHDTTARHDTKIKLLKREFGAEGYGVYFQILEIVGENVKENNQSEWSFVEEIHTMATLADEIGVTLKKFQKIAEFCNKIGLFLKIDGKLCVPKILDRLDEYARKRKGDLDLDKRQKELSRQTPDKLLTQSVQTPGLEKKRKEEKRKEVNTARYASLSEISDSVLQEIAIDQRVNVKDVKSTFEQMKAWLGAKGKVYKNYRQGLVNWVLKRIEDKKIARISSTPVSKLPELPEPSEEQRLKNRDSISGILKKFRTGYATA